MSKPKQLTIKDENERLIEAWASVEVRDKQGEIIPIEELEQIMPIVMDRGGLIMYRHSNKPIGKILKWEIAEHPEVKKKGLKLLIKIFNHYDFDDKVWEEIKEGKLKGISFGGLSKKYEITRDEGGRTARVLRGIEGYEFSIVENPANPFATIEAVNFLAKGDEEVEKYIRRRGDKWVVVSHDGKVLGEHDTYEDALRQLRAIEANKQEEVVTCSYCGGKAHIAGYTTSGTLYYCPNCDRHFEVADKGKEKEFGKMEGLRDILADAVYQKSFEELNEEEQENIQQLEKKVRAKVMEQVELELEKELRKAEVMEKAKESLEWFLSLPEDIRKEVEEIAEKEIEENEELKKIVSLHQIAGMVLSNLGKDKVERMSERELRNYIKNNFNLSSEEVEEVLEYLMELI